MKIGIVAYPNINQNVGGINLRIKRTIKHLKFSGIEARLFDQWNDKISDYDVLHVFKLHHSTWELVRAADLQEVPVVISMVLPPGASRAAWSVARKFWQLGLMRGTMAHALYKQAHIASRLIAVSNREKEMAAAIFGLVSDKISVISNCVDPLVFGAVDASAFRKLYGVDRYMICVGRVEPNKNQLNLLKACRGKSITPVIVGHAGEGHLNYYLECVRAGGDSAVFIDYLEPDSELLASAYTGAEIFAMPSHSEIAPNAALEAAISGAKIIITNNTQTGQEWFGDLVDYFDPSSVPSIELALMNALKRPGGGRLSDSVRENYTWENMTQRYKALYSDLAKGVR